MELCQKTMVKRPDINVVTDAAKVGVAAEKTDAQKYATIGKSNKMRQIQVDIWHLCVFTKNVEFVLNIKYF